MLVITHNHKGHLPPAGNKECHLPVYFTGNRGELPGEFVRDDFVTRYFPPVKILKAFQLAGLEAAYLSVDPVDGSSLDRLKFWDQWADIPSSV
jgi:hypothetical protein